MKNIKPQSPAEPKFPQGADLRAKRLSQKISQEALAKAVGVCRETVRYWEGRGRLAGMGLKMAAQVGLAIPAPQPYQSRPAPIGSAPSGQEWLEAWVAKRLIQIGEKHAAKLCGKCGAKTRKGWRCRNKVLGKGGRCKFHGGASTGPKTAEGRARIAQAQVQRWAQYRAAKE